MRQRMKNSLHISVKGVDLLLCSDIEFYLRQANLFRQYTPQVISSDEMLVKIPFEDAMKLSSGECRVQFALLDENRNPLASDPQTVAVDVLLKEAGYAPVRS